MNPQTYTAPQEQQEAPASFAAILPLLLFLLIFIGTGVSLSLAGVDMAFYQLSATVAILPAIALALMQGRARVDGLARRLAGKSGGKGSSRVGESCIALLASLADICTANNTVAIILTGGLAREIALKNGIDPRRSASLLDIFSCVFQGLIPWAAQLLLAGSLAKISPLEITINNWYCMLLAVAGILAIILGLPRIKARSTEA